MENSSRYFNNAQCKYYPCHKMPVQNSQSQHSGSTETEATGSQPQAGGAFNCLFCYCPLYHLGADCGGLFRYGGKKNVKICSDCYLPHTPDYYDVIINKLKEL